MLPEVNSASADGKNKESKKGPPSFYERFEFKSECILFVASG